MKLKQFEKLIHVNNDIHDQNTQLSYDIDPKFNMDRLMKYGFILLDKPPGQTSHEIVSTVKQILKISKAGHSGTLDPLVSGVLPIGLNDATKALNILHLGAKEYHAIGRLHSFFTKEKITSVLSKFSGNIYQKPPQRSSVLRQTRIRKIFDIELIEKKDNLILIRILCESGTYIRKLLYDIGELLGSGATMIELRRNQVSQFNENDNHLVTLHELMDAYESWTQKNTYSKLQKIILPIEAALSEIKAVVIRDSAVDALCHGAQLAIPGIIYISPKIKKGDLVAIYTLKYEIVALAESIMSENEIIKSTKGYAFKTKRIIMTPKTYQKNWRTKM